MVYDLSLDVGLNISLEIRKDLDRWDVTFRSGPPLGLGLPLLTSGHDILEAAIYDLAGRVIPLASKVEAITDEAHGMFERFSVSLLADVYFDVARTEAGWTGELRNLDRQQVFAVFGGQSVADVSQQAGRKLREFARDVAELVPRILAVAGA